MQNLNPEQVARQQIDSQLLACGWIVQDYKNIDFSAARGIAVREVPLKTGPCDYLLLVDRKALGVVEAKKVGTTLSTVADQSLRYASSLPDLLAAGANGPLPFLYESTGVETFFRDSRDPNSRSRTVFAFHRPETLAEWAKETNTLRARLAAMPTEHPLVTNGMRDCQIEAIKGLEDSLAHNRPRALIHMATGAGKTYTACAIAYRLIKHAKARRILFLVDRANLGEQARDEFHRFRTPDTGRLFTELYNVQHVTSPHIDEVCKVTICTIQRLYSILRGEDLPDGADDISGSELAAALGVTRSRDVAYNGKVPIEMFDFIIPDECHRSIYNLWRQVLEYFDGFLTGLTATPAPQTIAYFQQNCVAEYNHERAVTDGVNVGYDVYRIKTKVTEKGGKVEKGFLIDHRSKASRKARKEVPEPGGFMGLSFAIPIDLAMNSVAQLKEKGKVTRGRIGVQITEVSKETAESFGLAKAAGALVNSIEKGGPAMPQVIGHSMTTTPVRRPPPWRRRSGCTRPCLRRKTDEPTPCPDHQPRSGYRPGRLRGTEQPDQ